MPEDVAGEGQSKWRRDTIYLDESHAGLEVLAPVGPSRLVDLLPAARALAEEIVMRAMAHAAREHRNVSCRPGCGMCCRQLVGISAVEARGLAGIVDRMPAERSEIISARFERALKQLETAGLLDPAASKGSRHVTGSEPGSTWESNKLASRRYFDKQIPCPFLEQESCGIYEDRLMICREYFVSSPAEECGRPQDGHIRKIALPAYLAASLGKTAAILAGVTSHPIPLILSLEWSAANGRAVEQEYDGETMYQTWLSSIDPEADTPFDQR